jgi:hypothetical protein
MSLWVVYVVITKFAIKKEGFNDEVCTFYEDDTNMMTREAVIDINGQCYSTIVESESSKANDHRCRAAMNVIGYPERSSIEKCGYCILDTGTLIDTDDGNRCELLPTHSTLFKTRFDCSDNNSKLFDSITGKAGKVVSGINEDKNSGRCILTFKDAATEDEMRDYMEFLSINAECEGCEV